MQPQIFTCNKFAFGVCKRGNDQRLVASLLSDYRSFGLRTQIPSVWYSSEQIPRTLSVSQCYKLLGVTPDCSEEELRHAYLEKVTPYHF